MPGAKVRFHPNGGTGTNSYGLTSEGYSVATNTVSEGTMNLWNVNSIFKRDGYTGATDASAWRLDHPHSGALINQASVDLHTNYPVYFPNTTITLYAQWIYDTSTEFTITYMDGPTVYNRQTIIGFNPTTRHTLSTATPSSTNSRIFVGWDTVSTSHPKYYPGSDFYLTEPADIILYANYRSRNASAYNIIYNPNGGWYGVRQQDVNAGRTYAIPAPSSMSTTINQLYCPTRPGYKFLGWKHNGTEVSSDPFYPGAGGHWYSDRTVWTAQWERISGGIGDLANGSISLKNTYYNEYKESYRITPATYNRQFTLTFNTTTDTKTTKRVVMMRVVNAYCEEVEGSFIRYIIGSGASPIPAATVSLKANQTYYLEIVTEKVSNLTGQTYSFNISQSAEINTVTTNPNGGEYYFGSRNYLSTDILTHPFSSSDTCVGISTNTITAGLGNFSGVGITTRDYVSLPQRKGYQFKEWNCQNEPAKIGAQIISTAEMQTTLYTPMNDFNAIAIWNPNIFYIVYHNNNNHQGSGYMSDTEHYYNVQSNLWNNQYKKFAKITFNSRGGTYNNSWTNDANLTDITTDTTNSSIKSAVLNHTFLNWKVSNTTYSNQQAITLTPSNYGDAVDLYAQWQIESFTLPAVERAGFDFMGWYTDPDAGELVGMNGEAYSPEDPITLYAHWEPIGLVQIYVDNEWKYAIPYVYDGTTWKRAMQYTYNGTTWKQGAGSGQNMTNEQLEDL